MNQRNDTIFREAYNPFEPGSSLPVSPMQTSTIIKLTHIVLSSHGYIALHLHNSYDDQMPALNQKKKTKSVDTEL